MLVRLGGGLGFHYRSIASGAIGVIAFAVSLLGIPRVAVWTLLGVGVVMFALAAALWNRERKRPRIPLIPDPHVAMAVAAASGVECRDDVGIEVGPSAKYAGTSYIQHVRVTNNGPQATFSAQVTSDFAGLDRAYGQGNELVWERPQAAEKRLGKDQEGLLRLAEFERVDGQLVVRFFAVPEYRHQGHPGSYLPTMPYSIVADSLTFEFCVRNVDRDIVYRRSARFTFTPEDEPVLELREGRSRESYRGARSARLQGVGRPD